MEWENQTPCRVARCEQWNGVDGMIIQNYPKELNYCNAILHPLAPQVGSFLEVFCYACLRADSANYEILRPALLIMMDKYPADPERLRAEESDSKAHAGI